MKRLISSLQSSMNLTLFAVNFTKAPLWIPICDSSVDEQLYSLKVLRIVVNKVRDVLEASKVDSIEICDTQESTLFSSEERHLIRSGVRYVTAIVPMDDLLFLIADSRPRASMLAPIQTVVTEVERWGEQLLRTNKRKREEAVATIGNDLMRMQNMDTDGVAQDDLERI